MEILRRMMAAVLTLVMVVTMLPVSALAEETAGDDAHIVPETVETESAEIVGTVVPDGPEAAETEVVETVPETTAPEVFVEETAEVAAADAPVSGSCGENLTWTLLNGVLTISGSGKMYDYYYDYYEGDGTPWYELRGNITSVAIESGVTSIGDYAFYDCRSLSSITIPDSVTSIGRCAFSYCTSLASITIPDSVTSIGNGAFACCSSLVNMSIPGSVTSIGSATFRGCLSLVNVSIPGSVTSIGDYAFYYCTSLTSITMPDSVTYIGDYTFADCTSLASITIPDSVTYIVERTFYYCTSLTSITIPDSVTYIGYGAFEKCTSLIDVYYGGSKEQWTYIKDGAHNACLWDANIHYDSTGPETDNPGNSTPSIPGYTINTWHDDFFLFIGDPYIYNLDSLESGLGMRINHIDALDEEMLAPGDLTWTSSDESILRIIPDTADDDGVPQFEGLNTGTVTVAATNPQGDSMSLAVEVVRPNELVFTNTYSSEQYHSSGGFYSATSAISDCIEIFIQFANHKKDRCPCTVTEELLKNVPVIAPITLTATVSGDDLSFERDSYQNTYTMTYDPLEFESSVYDLLMLFPVDKNTFCKEHTTYTVKVALESESFVSALEETYTFTVYDLELLNAEEHIAFIEHDGEYLASKENIFGKGMAEILNNSPEYILSKWTTFDFDNYYDIVMADVLVGILDAPQNDFNAVPVILRNYQENYKKLVDGLYTIANNDYEDVLDVGFSENFMDKMLKATKYETDGIYAEDAIYQATVMVLGNTENIGKIQKVFSGIDKLGQVSDLVEVGTDALNDVAAWMNTVAVMNAFKDMDDEMKQMFQSLVDEIPDNEKKMKEAVERYLNYSHDFLGQITEITESLKDTVVGIGLSTFKPFVGKMLWDCFSQQTLGLIGTISVNGVSFSGTAAFSALSAKVSAAMGPVGAVVTGVSLGFCVSDLICNSGDKAEEGSKVLAMSEYSPYIIEVLKKYEENLHTKKNNSSVVLFENAFKLHQAAQSYIMDHTIKFLDEKAESWVQEEIIGNEECYDVAAKVLVCKNAIDNMRCCGDLKLGQATNGRKVIAIKCPVDVFLYDENGNEVVRILADTLEYAIDGFSVYIQDGEKYIAFSADQEYSVKIIATDEGTMDYAVIEYADSLEMIRVLEKEDIPLELDQVFTANLPKETGTSPEDYAITTGESVFVPAEPKEDVHFFQLGDVNHDNKINAKDATLILQSSVGVLKETAKFCEECAEVSGDGKLNAKDSTLILQFSVGLRDGFPAAEK